MAAGWRDGIIAPGWNHKKASFFLAGSQTKEAEKEGGKYGQEARALAQRVDALREGSGWSLGDGNGSRGLTPSRNQTHWGGAGFFLKTPGGAPLPLGTPSKKNRAFEEYFPRIFSASCRNPNADLRPKAPRGGGGSGRTHPLPGGPPELKRSLGGVDSAPSVKVGNEDSVGVLGLAGPRLPMASVRLIVHRAVEPQRSGEGEGEGGTP